MDIQAGINELVAWLRTISAGAIVVLLGLWLVWRHFRPQVQRFIHAGAVVDA